MHEEDIGTRCHEGFDLNFRRDARQRSPYYGSSHTHCSVCQGVISDVTQGYATCEFGYEYCDYDCCLSCFRGELPEGLIKGKTCGKMHALVYRTTTKSRSTSSGVSLGVRISCDLCKKGLSVWEGYYTCQEDCNYDICKTCHEQE